jgi:hypothetical protein
MAPKPGAGPGGGGVAIELVLLRDLSGHRGYEALVAPVRRRR